MPSSNNIFAMYRIIMLSAASIGSVIVLAMGAAIISFINNLVQSISASYPYRDAALGVSVPYAALGVAIASITLATIPVMLALSILRKGVLVNMVVVEISWLGLLFILWLATAGNTAAQLGGLSSAACSALDPYISGFSSFCMESQAMEAFAFLNWLELGSLFVILLSLAIMQVMRGNTKIWTECVTQADFFAPSKVEGDGAVSAMAPQFSGVPAQYPSPQQPQYPPQQAQYVPQPVQYAPQQAQYMPQAGQV